MEIDMCSYTSGVGVGVGVGVVALFGLKWFTGDIFVGLTIELSKNAPLKGMAGTFGLAVVLNGIWYLEAKRYARKVDYHV